MKAIILAAGLGTRLGPLTKELPKCLMEINGASILERQISELTMCGIEDICIVIGTKGKCWNQKSYERIRKLSKYIIYSFENDVTNNNFSLYLALQDIKNESKSILVIDGDVVFSRRFVELITSCPYENFLVTKEAKDKKETGNKVVYDDNDRVITLGKGLKPKEFPWDFHSGIFKISAKYVSLFRKLNSKPEFRADELEKPLRLFCKDNPLYLFRNNTKWINVNSKEDIGKAEKILERNQ